MTVPTVQKTTLGHERCALHAASRMALALVAAGLSFAACAQDAAAPAAAMNPATSAPTEGAAPASDAPAAPDAAVPAEAATGAPAPVAESEPAPAGAGTLQEILITATRHSEAMSKVPVSVSAFSQETLDLKGVRDFTDIARYTPGVAIDTNGTNNISIRGISSSGGSGTTGIYIDDTPIQMRALGFNADDTLPKTFDLDRVEVLRGPQGTLFGAGSEGGTVRYIMTQPNMSSASMYARSELAFTQGGAPSYEAGAAYGAPIVDNTLGFRASVWYRHDGGWIDQINPYTLETVQKDTNYANDVVVRVAAKWAVNESLSITPSVLYQDRAVNNVTAYWPIYSSPGSYKNADPDFRPEPDHYVLPSLKIESDVGSDATLISNTSFFRRSELSGYNGTEYNLGYYQTFSEDPAGPTAATPFNGNYYPLIDGSGVHLPASLQNYRAPATVTNLQSDFTQEIRLQSNDQANAKFTWTTGLFFSANRQISVEQINDPQMYELFQGLFNVSGFNTSGCPAFTPNASPAVIQEETVYCANGATVLEPLLYGNNYYLEQNGDSYYNYNFSRDKQTAIFGETTIALTDKLKGIAGARYAWTNVSFSHFADGPQNFIGPNPGSGTETDRPFTPKLGLSYQADRNDMYYTTWAKGFRIGGANPPIPTAACAPDLALIGIPSAPDSYKSDTVSSFEVGSKNNFHDQLRFASSLYYIKWHGIQQNIYLPGCGFQFTANVGEAVAKGGDMQIEWAPSASFEFEAAIGYTDARFSGNGELSPTASQPIVAAGDAVTGESGVPAAPWTVTLGGQYNFLALDHKSFIRMDWELQKHSNLLTPAEDASTSQYAYGFAYNPASTSFISLRAGTALDKRWNMSAFIDNLFDTHPTFPPSSYPYSDVDEYNPIFMATGKPGTSALIREYTFRPRTIGLTSTYRF